MSDLKALARRIYDEVFTEDNLDLIDELLHDDFVEHEQIPGVPTGKEAPRAFMTMARNAFPDFRMTALDILQDGNKVMVRARAAGTHKGEFMGIPATGNEFDIAVMDILEYEGDKVIGHWGVMDMAAMMDQLGVGGPPKF